MKYKLIALFIWIVLIVGVSAIIAIISGIAIWKCILIWGIIESVLTLFNALYTIIKKRL